MKNEQLNERVKKARQKDHLIDLIGVSKEYDGVKVLKDIDLYIRKKEFLTLLGPSGCGKTTTLRTITGFIEPVGGTVNVDGKDILVSRLSQLLLPFSGSFSFAKKEGISFEPLIFSSKTDACLVDRSGAQFGMGTMRRDLKPDGVQRTIAARLSGTFKTAFPK